MNIISLKDELNKLLKENGVSYNFNLEGGFPNDVYCMKKHDNGNFEVYYSERGQKYDQKIFKREDEACAYFYKIINGLIPSLIELKLKTEKIEEIGFMEYVRSLK